MGNRQQIPPGRPSQRQRIPCGGRTSAFPSACGPLRHPIPRKAPARSSHRQEATEPAVRSSSARFSNEPKHSSEVRSTTGHPLRNRASKAFFAIPPNRSERTDRSYSLPKNKVQETENPTEENKVRKNYGNDQAARRFPNDTPSCGTTAPRLRRNTDKTRSICNPPLFSRGYSVSEPGGNRRRH